ncbi:MAG: hypothetical protein IKJ39_11720 [Lachnospiraceae bacterium]|nr:hypothetical protein [Lachnospiraceae bacterium]
MIETFQKYSGTGLLVCLFLAAWFYLFFCEKKKETRVLFVYMPAVLLLLFFNPLFYKVFGNLTEEAIYFRFLWLLPITMVIAYTVIKIYSTLEGTKQYIFVLLSFVLIVFSGRLVYLNPLFEKAENPYHIPQEVIEICDMIEVEGREVVAAFPSEFILYVRQYSAMVCMPYGREAFSYYNPLHAAMNEAVIDAEKLAELGQEYGCHFLILNEEREMDGKLEDYSYEVYGKVGKYVVYHDLDMYIGMWGIEIKE